MLYYVMLLLYVAMLCDVAFCRVGLCCSVTSCYVLQRALICWTMLRYDMVWCCVLCFVVLLYHFMLY